MANSAESDDDESLNPDFRRLVEVMEASYGPVEAAEKAAALPGPEELRYVRAMSSMREQDSWEPALAALEALNFWALTVTLEAGLRKIDLEQTARKEVIGFLGLTSHETADEIVVLLRQNHPVAALSRWRRLFESSVLISVLADGDEALAQRFQDHERLRRDKEVFRRYRIAKEFGYDREEKDTVRAAQRRIDEVEARYGKDFGLEYGWATAHVLERSEWFARDHENGRPSPTFAHLSETAELQMMASEYAEASAAVHASTQLDGLVDGKRAFSMAGHNACYGISVSCGRASLAEESVIDDELNSAVDVIIEMSHSAAANFPLYA